MNARYLVLLGWVNAFIMAQNPAVQISTWKNKCLGAYNIIHDDFGDYSVSGIQNYADTMNYNRGLKFTFGAITSACENNPGMYAKAVSMINAHGHEIINHSHSHTCAIGNDWCTTGLWAEPATQNFGQEINYSTSSISTNTGYTPRYFIYPYDQFNTDANNHLKTQGYIGSRTGTYNGTEANTFAADAGGFFRSAFIVDAQTVGNVTKAVNLNYWVDFAIQNNRWVNRELHNVGSSGWGHVTVDEYRTHLNYVKQKVESGELWVGTISEILTYQMQKNYYTPNSSYNSTNKEITINWNSPSYNVANWLAPLQVKSPITLLVNLSAHPGLYEAYQNNVLLTEVSKVGNELRVNCYPHLGPVVLKLKDCSGVCISSQPSSIIVSEGGNGQFEVIANTTNGPLSYQWYFNGNSISGATSSILSFSNTQTTQSGNYYVIVSANSSQLQSNTVTLTVQSQQPYSGIIAIPGKIEMENFDNGGQGISWNESSATNEGSAGSYRTGPVDVENCSEGGYNIGYITDGEWLEYSVSVSSPAYYDFVFRIASVNIGPKPQVGVLVNGTTLLSPYELPYSGGWQTWQSVTVSGLYLNQGNQILRFHFPKGNVNVNFVNVIASSTLRFEFPIEFETTKAVSVKVYPNPAESTLMIYLPENFKSEYQCKIVNLMGVSVMEEVLAKGENEIAIESLQPGSYILELVSPEGIYISSFQKQ